MQQTSIEAYLSLQADDISALQRRIHDLLSMASMTDEELCERIRRETPLSDSGIRSRRAELVERGMVRASGRFALSHSGRRMIIWEAVR